MATSKKTTIPATAKQPQDRQAKAEAKREDIIVEHNGDEYTIDREAANNVEILELIEDEKYISALRAYLGSEQWGRWKDANRDDAGRVPQSAFEEFLNAAMSSIGGEGNSAASSGS